MKTYLEYHHASSHKFWEISVKGSSHTVRFGKVGAAGQTKTKDFDSSAAAKKDADRLIGSKTKKGYEPVAGGTKSKKPASPAKKPAAKSKKPAPKAKAGATYLEWNSQKFWEVSVKGSSHTVRFGKVGAAGQTKTKDFDSSAAAKKDVERLIGSKTKKGYEPVAGTKAKKPASPAKKPAAKSKKPASPAKKPAAKAKKPASKAKAGATYLEWNSQKFWEVSVKGSSHTVRFGKVGAAGQTKTKDFDSSAAAKKDADRLIGSKTKKGYEPVAGGTKAKKLAAKPLKASPEQLLKQLATATRQRNTEEVERLLPAVVKQNKQMEDLWAVLMTHGLALNQKSDRTPAELEASRLLLKASLKLDPNPTAYLNLTWTLVEQHNSEAAAMAEAGLKRESVHRLLFHNAACAFAQAGKLEKAMECVRHAKLAADPHFKTIAKDTDLKPLWKRSDFKELFKAGHEFDEVRPWTLPNLADCYPYNEGKLKKHALPALLVRFGRWVATQQHGRIGWFDEMRFERIWKGWDPKLTPRLNRDGFVFLTLGEGSMVVLLPGIRGQGEPAPVIRLDSEGGEELLAQSLEEFLMNWSKGKSGIHDLDEVSAGRGDMKKWLKQRGVKKPKIANFDLQTYLGG